MDCSLCAVQTGNRFLYSWSLSLKTYLSYTHRDRKILTFFCGTHEPSYSPPLPFCFRVRLSAPPVCVKQSNQTCYQGGLTASIAPSGLGMGLPMGGGDVGVVGPVDNAQQQQHLSNTSSGPCVSNHSPPMHQPQQQQHQQQQPPWGRPRLLSGGDMGTFCGTIPGQQGGGVLPAGQGMNGGAGGQGPRMNGQGFGPRPAGR